MFTQLTEDLALIREDLEFFGIPLPKSLSVDDWATKLARKPCQNTLLLAGVASLLFYRYEKGHNPKVNDIYDAMVYCTTCLSVGYADIFAKTPMGKVLGSLLMTIGPALTGRALDGQSTPPAPAEPDSTQLEILTTLKQILARLEASDAT